MNRSRVITIAATAWLLVGATAAVAAPAPAAPAPTAPAATAPAAGSAAASPDTAAAPPESAIVATSAPAPPRGDLDVDRLLGEGRTSPTRLFESRWPVDALELPVGSAAFWQPRTLDAGIPLAGWTTPTTDRTPVSGLPLYFGAPNASLTVTRPGRAENDPFLVTAWQSAAPRPPMEGPSELLARPKPTLWWQTELPAAGGPGPAAPTGGAEGSGLSGASGRPMSSALLYEKGAFGMDHAGARFAAPALFPGLAGAYTWRASDGAEAWRRAVDTRYALVALLPRWSGFDATLQADQASRKIDSAIPDPIEERLTRGEARLDERRLALGLVRKAGLWTHEFTAEAARSKHLSIDADSVRERWEEPYYTLQAVSTWRPSLGWTWIVSGKGVARDIESRYGPGDSPTGIVDASVATSAQEGRAGISVRRERVGGSGRARTLTADLAYDARDGDAGFLDARLGASVASPQGLLQLDLESAHERTTWEDRLLPARDRVFADVLVLPKALRYSVEAGRPLAPRRLNGAVARAVWRAAPALELTASGSARHVEHDFGWNLERSESLDSIFVIERLVERGSGWTSHASLEAALAAGPIRLRALGWVRGGPSGLTPLAGSPARQGLDASLDAGATFFQGDLPLRLRADAHVSGERTGAIREGAATTLDGSLLADFTNAAVYLKVEDVLDRRAPSGVYDLATDSGVPSLGRRFRFGVVWHLLD